MKKYAPYLVGGTVLLLLLVVVSQLKPMRRFDERITLRQRDKIPYGTAVARQLLPSIFPAARMYTDARSPGMWDSIDAGRPNQAVILMSGYFDADREELERLNDFVANGNFVYIIARSFSDASANFFDLSFSGYFDLFADNGEDSLRLRLMPPVFSADSFFVYPGKRYEGTVRKYDSTKTVVLGKNDGGWPNFVRLNRGRGSFFIHTAPLAFSNYFILHKQNKTYYQNALSVIPQNATAVLWNEYYLQKPQSRRDKDVNWLGALFRQPSFRWGFLIALFTLVLYLLLGMRRRQRIIPPYEQPANDSLDFVKTLGRLYFDKRDHKDLAEKMGAHFLEHVRSTYKIATHTLDDEFVTALHRKSGYAEPELKRLVQEVQSLPEWPNISEERLATFYKSLELFYQNT